MKKTVITHFFTTIRFTQVFRTAVFVLNPYNFIRFKNGKFVGLVEERLLQYLNLENSKIVSFYNARSALFHSLKLLGVGEDDEVILQAYTCVSVANAIIQTGAKPIYVDIDETLNIDIDSIVDKISPRTKVIVIQHTFGNPAHIDEITRICKEKNIFLLEDCAHSLGAEYKGKKVGSFGDVSIFSFGRDKVISTVNGGFMIVNNQKFFSGIEAVKNSLHDAPTKEVLKNVFYIFASFKARIFYDFFSLGKYIIYIARKLTLIPEVLTSQEKQCKNKDFYYKYLDVLAYIGLKEIDTIDEYNNHRIKLAKIYEKNLDSDSYPKTLDGVKNIYLRFVFFTQNRERVKSFFKEKNVLLGDWYDTVIAPSGTLLENTFYEVGSCPKAEKFAQETVNLPNTQRLNEEDVGEILNVKCEMLN